MQLLFEVCQELGIAIDDARMCLMDIRPDWETTDTCSTSEADLIRQSVRAALPESNGEITPVADMDLTQQEQLINNASQVLGFPLVLAAMQEIKAIDTLHQVKNAIALNVIDRRQAELDAAIRERSIGRQQAYVTAIEDLASQMQKPIEVVAGMKADIDETNAKLDALLATVKAGK
ncbi:MAG: hypothetical protein KME31_25190 [Tolypothrix carrinoi HA7290-LM1]|jgi:hypothetical protein|nr:hypothetical protein [Tolypothrix carrinoi HA7290-LM1]